jgi:putative aldouronate transport system substrate-binding protein
MIIRLKNEANVETPMQLFPTVEGFNGMLFGGMNTGMVLGVPTRRVENSRVVFTLSEEIDRQALQMLVDWTAEGLIDQTWMAGDNGAVAVLESRAAYIQQNPNYLKEFSSLGAVTTPGFRLEPMYRARLTEDFKFRYANGIKEWDDDYASWSISVKCENIPLAVSYADWMYSDEGKFFISYGLEDVTYYYDDNGIMTYTDFILGAVGTLPMLYGANQFVDVGIIDNYRMLSCNPAARDLIAKLDYWIVPGYELKGSMDWPSIAAKPTEEENQQIAALSGDLSTYVQENIVTFIEGSKPMSEWDSYVATLKSVGLDRLQLIYQRVYDEFIEAHPDYAQKN